MWKQTKTGYYTNGVDVLEVNSYGCDAFRIYKNEKFLEDFDSLEELNLYLSGMEAEPIFLPKTEVEYNKWFMFEGLDNGYVKAFTRKLEDETLQTVIIAHFSDCYSVVMRERFYSCDEYMETSFEFAEEMGRSAKDVLDMDAYETMTHGSSGMDAHHHDLQTMDDVKNILQNKYGIVYEE